MPATVSPSPNRINNRRCDRRPPARADVVAQDDALRPQFRPGHLVLVGRPNLLAELDLGLNHDIKSRVTYSVVVKRLNPDCLRDFLLRELDRAGLGHNTFTQPAIDLIVRSADGVLRKARNLCIGCLIEAVRGANKTIDIDTVNRVLMQPHWQKDVDLVEY